MDEIEKVKFHSEWGKVRLYNKVDTIEKKVSELQELIPEASIGFVHGQMSEIRLTMNKTNRSFWNQFL